MSDNSPPWPSIFPRERGALLAELIRRAQALPPVRMGVVHPCDRPSLEGALAARDRGLIVPTLIGPCKKIEAAAREAGLAYAHIPVRGGPGPAEVEAVRELVAATDGPVLAFCRSGTRSIVTWSIGQAQSGAMARGELVTLGREAGYDLSGVLGG